MIPKSDVSYSNESLPKTKCDTNNYVTKMGVIINRFTVIPSFLLISLSESYVMISKGHVKSSLFTTGHVVSKVNLIQHFWHETRVQHYE